MKFYLVVGLCLLSFVAYNEGKVKPVDLTTLISPQKPVDLTTLISPLPKTETNQKSVDLSTLISPLSETKQTNQDISFLDLIKPPNSVKDCECASWYTRLFSGLCKKKLIDGHTFESESILDEVTIKNNVITYERNGTSTLPKDSFTISILRESDHNCNVWHTINKINMKTNMGVAYTIGKTRFTFFANQDDKILNKNYIFIVMDSKNASVSTKLWKFNWDPQTDILYCMNIVLKENVDCAIDEMCKGFQLTNLPNIFDPTKIHPDLSI